MSSRRSGYSFNPRGHNRYSGQTLSSFNDDDNDDDNHYTHPSGMSRYNNSANSRTHDIDPWASHRSLDPSHNSHTHHSHDNDEYGRPSTGLTGFPSASTMQQRTPQRLSRNQLTIDSHHPSPVRTPRNQIYYSHPSRLNSVNSRDGLTQVSPERDSDDSEVDSSPTRRGSRRSKFTHISPVRTDYHDDDYASLSGEKGQRHAQHTPPGMPHIPAYNDVESELFADEDESDTDEEDDLKNEFNPYPTFENSYYPVNTAAGKRKYYDPFEMNKYDDDAESREGVDVETLDGDDDADDATSKGVPSTFQQLPQMPQLQGLQFNQPLPQPHATNDIYDGAFNQYTIPDGHQVIIQPAGPGEAEIFRHLTRGQRPVPPAQLIIPPMPGLPTDPSRSSFSDSTTSSGLPSLPSKLSGGLGAAGAASGKTPMVPQVVKASGKGGSSHVNDEEGSIDQVEMVNGNLVLDCHVSDLLFKRYPIPITPGARELLFMRYQAVTCQPAQFIARNFTLRQRFYLKPRETELLIVITMFNENELLLAKTLKGVFRNIRYLYSLKKSSVWGQDAWQKVVVCIVSDGRKKIDPKALALLGTLGVYQAGFAKSKVNEEPVVSHVYEYTTMVGILKVDKDHVKLTTKNQVPIQMVFCLKERNQRKINSHSWAFEAFCPELNPKVVILLDVGTEPEHKSIYKLWRAFKDDRVAGACGEIKASLGRNGKSLLNPLVAAQNFEYKMSNILDKPMESLFGFITVLPGAFSAYRYEALKGAPLDKYLKGQDLKKSNNGGIFNANMYLAEDRILCFELVAKRHCGWILKYVNTARAVTDVPGELHEFITQRRRWMNGSFFALLYSTSHFYQLFWTSHSILRKLMLLLETFYQLINLLVNWFGLGSYYLVFRILTVYMAESSVGFAPGNVFSVLLLWVYLGSIVTTFVLSFGNKPKGTQKFYMFIVGFFALLMCYMVFAAIFLAVKSVQQIYADLDSGEQSNLHYFFTNERFRDLIIATSSTYALYFIASFMFLEPWHMFTSFVQYLLLSPAYINVLQIYAFCNIHDISWGTKGEDKVEDLGIAKIAKTAGKKDVFAVVIPTTKAQIDSSYKKSVYDLSTKAVSVYDPEDLEEDDVNYFAAVRSFTVLTWMLMNMIVVSLITETAGLYQWTNDLDDGSTLPKYRSQVYLTVILWIVAFMALFRFLGCCGFLFDKLIDYVRYRHYLEDRMRQEKTGGAIV